MNTKVGDLTALLPAAGVDGAEAELRGQIDALLPQLRQTLIDGLTDPGADEVVADGEGGAAEAEARTLAHLEWVTKVRNELLTPVTEAAVAARDAAIRRAMEHGTPASALVGACGLTVARVYQIRDGRR